jgi:sugar phosphate isomerase/epimerase
MKIGVSGYSFRKHQKATGCSYTDLCDQAKALGFEGIEFIDLKTADDIAEAKKIRAHCEAIGLPIVAYTVGANLQAEDLRAEIERLKGCVDVAHALGAPVMRHDVASKLREVEGNTWENAIEDMVPAVREITEYAASKGIRTCSENHGYIFQDSLRVESLIRAVGHKNYGWLVDMGNFLCVDEDPLSAVRRAAPYAFHAHAKDFLYHVVREGTASPEGYFRTRNGNLLRGTAVGHGVVPVEESVKVLRESGYDGWLSVEFEGMEENIPALSAGLAYLKKIV